jgi:hypothetical protein
MVRVELWEVKSESGSTIKTVYSQEEAEKYESQGYAVEKFNHYETVGKRPA